MEADPLIVALTPYIEVIVMALVTAFLGWIAQQFQRWTGMNIEEKHREALQSALRNGVLYSLRETPRLSSRNERVQKVFDYLNSSVPDALAYFEKQGLSPEGLRKLIEPHLPMEGSNAKSTVTYSDTPESRGL